MIYWHFLTSTLPNKELAALRKAMGQTKEKQFPT